MSSSTFSAFSSVGMRLIFTTLKGELVHLRGAKVRNYLYNRTTIHTIAAASVSRQRLIAISQRYHIIMSLDLQKVLLHANAMRISPVQNTSAHARARDKGVNVTFPAICACGKEGKCGQNAPEVL